MRPVLIKILKSIPQNLMKHFFSEDVLKQENGECVICFENLSIGRQEPLPAQEHGIYMSSKFA